MPEGEALFFMEMGVMIKKIREKTSAFRTKKQQVLGIRGQEKSPQSHQFWISDSILRLVSGVFTEELNTTKPHLRSFERSAEIHLRKRSEHLLLTQPTPAKRRLFYGRDNPLVSSSFSNWGRCNLYVWNRGRALSPVASKKNIKKKLETGNHRVVKPEPVQPAISAKPVVRGYDSRDLFWEDALLRIDEVKRQIAADLKKQDQLFATPSPRPDTGKAIIEQTAAYLQKPVNSTILLMTIERVLAKSQLRCASH